MVHVPSQFPVTSFHGQLFVSRCHENPTEQAFKREKKRALMENQDAFAAQAEAMAVRMRKQAAASLQKVTHRAAWQFVDRSDQTSVASFHTPRSRYQRPLSLSHLSHLSYGAAHTTARPLMCVRIVEC